jgi:2-methylcitrate dehydratase PrpD
MLAQYSTPFCVALGLLKDPLDPRSFSDANLHDEAVRALCRKVRIEMRPGGEEEKTPWVTIVQVTLKDGRQLEQRVDSFKGMPDNPVSRTELSEKFHRLAGDLDAGWRERLLGQLLTLEQVDDLTDLGLAVKN